VFLDSHLRGNDEFEIYWIQVVPWLCIASKKVLRHNVARRTSTPQLPEGERKFAFFCFDFSFELAGNHHV